jgi:sarcosine/dimethylglycine N-methyltransferase
VRTYGDFQETYADNDPDFFIHVAEKSALPMMQGRDGPGDVTSKDIRDVTEQYYDSEDADGFYSMIWGGEDLHVGLYESTQDIRAASDAIVDYMRSAVPTLCEDSNILDIGSGYGGSMRRVVGQLGNRATCLNLSETQNDTNRLKTRQSGLAERITVTHGTFEKIPETDGTFDVVWSQDALLHSDERETVLSEVWRVLKPNGYFVFTDPCQADDVPEGVLQPVYDRLHLNSLGSFRFYREAALALGFEVERQDDMITHMRTHYSRVREELEARYDELQDRGISNQYLDQMLVGLQSWVDAADQGHLAWGLNVFRKPA